MVALDNIPRERRRPLKRAEYDRLVEMGVFNGEKVELISGMLVAMRPQKAPHVYVTHRLRDLLYDALRGRARVFSQAPVALSDDSEPEPDVFVVPRGEYARELPSQPLLIVEVADTTVKDDREIKGPLYAVNRVPEFWLVNIPERVVEVYRDPRANVYGSVERRGPGEALRPLAFPDVQIKVSEILPPE